VCTACLGTLQYADDDALTIQPIITRLESTPYETSNFALTLTLPVSLLHRGRLLGLYIQDQLEHHHKNTTHLWTPAMVRDPKDPIRMLLIQRLAQSSGLLGDLESPFHINLCLGHPPTETEHLFLTKMKDPILQLRQVRKRVSKANKK
jgi:tRNA pseudouridine synthase 10